MDKDYIQQLVYLSQGRIRLQDTINLLRDLDKWSIIIGDNHLDIEQAITHLASLETSIATRINILADKTVTHDTK